MSRIVFNQKLISDIVRPDLCTRCSMCYRQWQCREFCPHEVLDYVMSTVRAVLALDPDNVRIVE